LKERLPAIDAHRSRLPIVMQMVASITTAQHQHRVHNVIQIEGSQHPSLIPTSVS
jgi:hypothetical protein